MPDIGTRELWREARLALLDRQKELIRSAFAIDTVSPTRR